MITLHNCLLSKYRTSVQISWANAHWRMPEKKKKRIWMLFLSKHSVLRKKKKPSMRGIIFTTGTKDKMDPSTSATTNCQLRIRLSCRACLNKPVNMALLTSCNGVPCQAKCCVFSSQVTANWFYTATIFLSSWLTSERDKGLTYRTRRQDSIYTTEARVPARPTIQVNLEGTTPQTIAFKWHRRW